VNTEDGAAFSSRSLNGIDILSLKEKMENKVTHDYLERYRSQWSDDQIESTARDVTIGALKYGLLRVDNNTQIHFSESEWLKLDGDTGPYLQYVHARCFSILEKLGKPKESFDPIYSEKEEKELLFLLWRFNEFALLAASQYRPSVIAGYLYDLARSFNRFYEHCSIKSSEGNVKETRLFLVSATQKIMACGLDLLGIHPLEKM
jgi:arginyl-tRNA synthetase